MRGTMNVQLNNAVRINGSGRPAQEDNVELANKGVGCTHTTVAGPQGSDDLFTSRPLNRSIQELPAAAPSPPMKHRFLRLPSQALRVEATLRAAQEAERLAYRAALRALAAYGTEARTKTPFNSPCSSP